MKASHETTFAAQLAELARAPGTPVIAVADRLIGFALESKASDVHVEPEASELVMKFRKDGVLHEVARLERRLVPTLVARLKVLADLPTYIVDAPQDGRIPKERARASADIRISTVPTVHGEKAVLRIFDPSARLLDLSELGLPGAAAHALERAVLSPRGVVVLAGPAGSGKSTTIQAVLNLIRERSRGTRSIVGIEDPVERVIPGLTQVQVNAASGLGFQQALKALLRQDPEVIYLGEARDAATALVAIEAGLTGHLVITTVHAGSCPQVFARLLEMGIEPHLLTSALSTVLAQRLVRAVCTCAEPDATLAPSIRARLGGSARPVRAIGCPACQETGYEGRLPIVEHAVPSPGIRKAILARADETAFAAELARDGLRTLADHGLELVARGKTTMEELERVLGPLE
ncbi:type II/IV secretion system protein [bacterium]|nr:type II/IV secretion system protein [bacterium]